MYKKLIILGDIWRHCVKFKGIKAAQRLSLLCIVDKENRNLFSLAYMGCKGMVMCVIQKNTISPLSPFRRIKVETNDPLKLQLGYEHFSEQWNPSNGRVVYKRGETPSAISGSLS